MAPTTLPTVANRKRTGGGDTTVVSALAPPQMNKKARIAVSSSRARIESAQNMCPVTCFWYKPCGPANVFNGLPSTPPPSRNRQHRNPRAASCIRRLRLFCPNLEHRFWPSIAIRWRVSSSTLIVDREVVRRLPNFCESSFMSRLPSEALLQQAGKKEPWSMRVWRQIRADNEYVRSVLR